MSGPDPHRPKEIHLVGRYALGVDWLDNHGSIFPFDYLRAVCPCRACREAEAGGAPGPRTGGVEAWPTEIKKEAGGLRIRWQDGHETVFGGRQLRELCRCAICTGDR